MLKDIEDWGFNLKIDEINVMRKSNFEKVLKLKCKNMIMTTPTNKGLTDNLLPLWTGRELSEIETLELLEEVEGKIDKGKLLTVQTKTP